MNCWLGGSRQIAIGCVLQLLPFPTAEFRTRISTRMRAATCPVPNIAALPSGHGTENITHFHCAGQIPEMSSTSKRACSRLLRRCLNGLGSRNRTVWHSHNRTRQQHFPAVHIEMRTYPPTETLWLISTIKTRAPKRSCVIGASFLQSVNLCA